MSDINTNPTEAVAAQDPVEANDYNVLEMFARFWGVLEDDFDDTPNQNVDLPTLFQAWMQNVRPEALGTNKIRVPFTTDRPPSLFLDNHLIQNTADADSPTITGVSGTYYILANRSGKNFTVSISSSSIPGDDQRVIGSFEWDGSAIVDGSIESYELEGSGAITSSSQQVCQVWAEISSTGSIRDSYGLSSVSRPATGQYLLSFSRTFLNTNYAVVAMTETQQLIPFYANQGLNQCEVHITNTTGTFTNTAFAVIIFGDV